MDYEAFSIKTPNFSLSCLKTVLNFKDLLKYFSTQKKSDEITKCLAGYALKNFSSNAYKDHLEIVLVKLVLGQVRDASI